MGLEILIHYRLTIQKLLLYRARFPGISDFQIFRFSKKKFVLKMVDNFSVEKLETWLIICIRIL